MRNGNPMTRAADVYALLDRQRAEVIASLVPTPEYQRLSEAAAIEEATKPNVYFARNRLALHVEMNMPTITETLAATRRHARSFNTEDP